MLTTGGSGCGSSLRGNWFISITRNKRPCPGKPYHSQATMKLIPALVPSPEASSETARSPYHLQIGQADIPGVVVSGGAATVSQRVRPTTTWM